MRRVLTTLLLTLCFSAALCAGASAQEGTKATTQSDEAAEAVGSLVALLKDARANKIPRTQSTQRLSRVRAEGCVLRYNLVTEYESPVYHSWDRPQVSDSSYRLIEREFTVNLADLDAAGVKARFQNQLKRKSGGSVLFRTLGGRESVRERWVQNSRLGTRLMTRQSRAGGLPVGDDGSLETVAAALKRAAEVCAAVVR